MVNKQLGFSLWLDFIERDYLKNEFSKLVKKGIINGATSNPSIFASAITTSQAYSEQLKLLSSESPKKKYEAMATTDIKNAAIALRGLYDQNNDGYISMEVDPFLSNDTEATVAEGKRLFETIKEPNVMIKVPATTAGYKAMTELLSDGISVNATLIFSPTQAKLCLDAMQKGISKSKRKVDAVISVFVSRFDRHMDTLLKDAGIQTGRFGIMNAAKIYNIIEDSKEPNIRTLFASTGVKGDQLKTDYYIHELLASHSINTAPLATIQSYIQNLSSQEKLPISNTDIDLYFEQVLSSGINIDHIYSKLLDDGLVAFEEAFSVMLESLA